MSVAEKIYRLLTGLYPKGRAWRFPLGKDVNLLAEDGQPLLTEDDYNFVVGQEGWLAKLHKVIAVVLGKAWDDALSIYDSTIADNPNFTADDASDWEIRLGIISGTGVSLADRILAINQKLNYPLTDAPRQHYSYIQAELQAAGFNVTVWENTLAQSPAQILGASGAVLHSDLTFHGPTTYHGGGFSNKLANHIEEQRDAQFVIGSSYACTFIIADAASISTFVNVSLARKDEFRQLLLKLKPVNTVAFLFVNYV